MSVNADQVTILGFDDQHFRAQWRNLFILIWRGAVAKAATEQVAEDIDALRKSQARGVGLCVIIEESSPVPGANERQWSKDMFNRLGKDLQFVAAIPEGKSMWATAARTMLTAFQLVMPAIYQQRVFSVPSEGATWIAERMSDKAAKVTEQDVTRALDIARAGFPRKIEPDKQKAAGGILSFLRKG